MIELLRDTEGDGKVIRTSFFAFGQYGIQPCLSRANLARHVEGKMIAVDGGVPPWYRPP